MARGAVQPLCSMPPQQRRIDWSLRKGGGVFITVRYIYTSYIYRYTSYASAIGSVVIGSAELRAARERLVGFEGQTALGTITGELSI